MNCDVERKQDSGTRAMTMFSYVRTPVNNTFVTKKMLSFMLSICFNSSFWNHGPGCWQINEVHEQFIIGLRKLFEKYKEKAGYPGLHLRVLWHSSTRLQLGFSNNVALRCSPEVPNCALRVHSVCSCCVVVMVIRLLALMWKRALDAHESESLQLLA